MRANHPSTADTSIEELAPFVTVEQAARVLGIFRTAAYELAKQWERTDGRSGLPVIRLGRTLRVPRLALIQLQ
jgi:hypothetical protein